MEAVEYENRQVETCMPNGCIIGSLPKDWIGQYAHPHHFKR